MPKTPKPFSWIKKDNLDSGYGEDTQAEKRKEQRSLREELYNLERELNRIRYGISMGKRMDEDTPVKTLKKEIAKTKKLISDAKN